MSFFEKLLQAPMRATEEGKPLHALRPLAEALLDFFYPPSFRTKDAPFIRDSIDLKRWMMMVIFALTPCIFMAIWNTGVQKLVYESRDYQLMDSFLKISSLKEYFIFVFQDGRALSILMKGSSVFFPIMITAYMAGGLSEILFACFRRHKISEGFVVSGMLVALILPPSIPLWMVAFGTFFGIMLSKELFGGVGMNIVNPAIVCRILLFFTFPAHMTGDIWVGSPPVVRESLTMMNKDGKKNFLDGYTQATPLAHLKVAPDVKRLHINAIGALFFHKEDLLQEIMPLWNDWAKKNEVQEITKDSARAFLTDRPPGLHLSEQDFEEAYQFSKLYYGAPPFSIGNFFFGNRLGSMGETSVIACLLGLIILLVTGVTSWILPFGVFLGAFGTASIFNFISSFGTLDLIPAIFSFPAAKHLLVGGLAFGAVFMATDPVSAPSLKLAKLWYGLLIGFLTIIIRTINPAYPEGTMLAILFGNIFSPLLERGAALVWKRSRRAFSNTFTILFIVVLSTVTAFIISLLATSLKIPKENAKKLDQSKEFLIAARLLNEEGFFQIPTDGTYTPATYTGKGTLLPTEAHIPAKDKEILDLYRTRVQAFLVDKSGKAISYQEAGLQEESYLNEHKKEGFSKLSLLPIFKVLSSKNGVESYVIPISGFGLWDRIYGFLAIKPDGKTIIGTTWYDQKETPGLGGTIAERSWQKQFQGKSIFQPDMEGKINIEKAPLGITVIKGKVEDRFGSSPRKINSVDGISGATLTGNGVTRAYKECLEPYRPFFEKIEGNSP